MKTYEIKLSRGLSNFRKRGISLNANKPPAIRSSIVLRIKTENRVGAKRIATKQMGSDWKILSLKVKQEDA